MMVEVLLFDAKPGGVFEVVSYSVFADGRLEIALADGTVKTWDEGWMDVGPAGSFRPNPARPPRLRTAADPAFWASPASSNGF